MGEHRGGGWKKAKEDDAEWRRAMKEDGRGRGRGGSARGRIGENGLGESRKTSGRMKEDDGGWRWMGRRGTPSKCVCLIFLVNANAASSRKKATGDHWVFVNMKIFPSSRAGLEH
jgi:hypothetical protein